MMDRLPPALEGLARYRQFIVYLLTPSMRRPGKYDKTPINPMTFYPVNPLDHEQWFSAEDAIKHAKNCGDNAGIGFVFTQHDPFFFLDIDECLIDRNWSPRALQLMDIFKGAAVEVSQSGRGLHIIGSGECPPHSCKHKAEHLELYTESRFVALTGEHTEGSVLANMSKDLPWLVETFFSGPQRVENLEWSHLPVPEWNGPWDDDILIAKAMSTQGVAQAFRGKASFQDLFEANVEALARVYPDSTGDKGRPYDESSADMALALHLAFWTGKNHQRMLNIMMRSKLVREKWDREKYMHDTIQNACSICQQVYSITYTPGGGSPALAAPVAAVQRNPDLPGIPAPGMPTLPAGTEGKGTPMAAPGVQFMPASEQPEYFRGCVYIRDSHKVLTPDGAMLKPDQFRSMYSGFTFAIDMSNAKTTKSAWEAFIENQAWKFPKVNRHVFRPELPPLKLFDEEGEPVVNAYVPIPTKRRKGDPAPFLDLLQKMLPVAEDRRILLAYMAALVQYPGVKFQWCPILQGAEGNGKTTIMKCVEFAVGRRYSHFPSALDIANKFNGWIAEKLFIGVDEICVGDRTEILDALKPMITNTSLDVQRKGVDQATVDNRANFMATTNHKDAVRTNRDTRRWCIFFTAQQSAADLQLHAMHGSYFPLLQRWLIEEGFEIVNDFLREYQIPDEYNPAGMCVRAPPTSATSEAREVSSGTIEQEILEAVEIGLPGFRNHWISSIMLDKLLETRRLARFIPRQRRRQLLQSIGYDWHPQLVAAAGRCPTQIMQEGGKPVLFFNAKAVPEFCKDVAEVRNAYMRDQGYDLLPSTYPIGKPI